MKIRTKLILIIISAFVVSFVVQLSFSLYNQNRLTVQEFGEHGKLLAKQISIASLDAMLEQDYYKLIDIIEANKSEASVVNIQIYDGTGKMVASLEADKPGSADAFNGKLPAEIIAQEENGLLVVYAPIIKGLKGVVRLTLSEDWINRQMTLSAALAAGIALVSLILLSVVCVIVIQRFIIAPINSTVTTIRDITGEKDLRKKIAVKSNDEMKVLASCFNDFTATLTEILREIGLLVNKIRKISGNLASSSEESTAALNEIKEHLQIIKEETSDLDNEMTRSNQTSAEVKQFISNVTALISSLAADIAESTASMEEMSSSIQNISNVAKDKLNLANELEETAISGESEMINAVNQIRNVAASADVMQEMTNVINNMAAQTNLLAMNAAIEAAHAGEAGRGFAVVADEIRKLAENAGSSSKEIARSLKQINNYIQVTEESTGKAGELFLKIVEGVKSVADSMTEMNTSTAELAAGSNQIMHSFTSILKTSESVRLSSDTMDEKVSGITGSIDRLSVLSGKLKNGMVEIMAGIDELLKTAGSVLESGNTSVDSITELSDSVSQFRIE